MMIIGVLSPAHRCACQGHRLDRKLYLEWGRQLGTLFNAANRHAFQATRRAVIAGRNKRRPRRAPSR